MADKTGIEWTDATWNPITGCSVVSPGCTHCYAMHLAGTRLKHHPSRAGLTRRVNNGYVWTGEIRFHEDLLLEPLGWEKPQKIFVCAHGDLFHESVPHEWIDRVFAVMSVCPQHTFQILTKRSARMRKYVNGIAAETKYETALRVARSWPKNAKIPDIDINILGENKWFGVSVEDQRRADERIPDLLATPAAVRFISFEPLLGPIDPFDMAGIHWAVVGGERCLDARPMRPQWARDIRDQCAEARVPFFFKRWGNGFGRELNGRTHDDMPEESE